MLSRTSRGGSAPPLRLATSGLAMTISPWSGNRADILSHLVDVPVLMEHFKGKSPSSSKTMGSEEEWSGHSTWMILATGFTLPLWKQNNHTNLGLDPPRCGCENYPLLRTINRVLRAYPSPDPQCDGPSHLRGLSQVKVGLGWKNLESWNQEEQELASQPAALPYFSQTPKRWTILQKSNN